MGDRERGHLRLLLGAALLAAVGVLAAGCAAQHSRQPQVTASQHLAAAGSTVSSKATVTRQATPYGANGQLAVTVGDVASGNCWTTSVAAPVAGAYRCFAGNQILDPCFAPPGQAAPTQVACLSTPWSDALVLQLTNDLPAPAPPVKANRPWAIELSNGARCVASTGTVPAVQGVNLEYHCTNGHDAALLDTTASATTASYDNAAGTALSTVTVTTIWRA